MNKNKHNPIFESINLSDVDTFMTLFASKKDLMLLNSAKLMEGYGEYSFICFDAFASFWAKGRDYYWNNEKIKVQNPFDFINAKMKEYLLKKNKALPDFQGGAVGYFGYEANHYLETLPATSDNMGLADIHLNFYASVIAINHASNQSWIISTGFPEKTEDRRIARAKENIRSIQKTIQEGCRVKNNPHLPQKIVGSITSNFTREAYIQNVFKTKEYILNGDIFEANITQQFSATLTDTMDMQDLYSRLMKINPAPFSAFFKLPHDGYIISASPERFIKVSENSVESSPIKGTRKRSKDENEDRILMEELLSSEKDRAENIMIVDLMRNDLSRVCKPGSIEVKELCALKSFETVHHLVSTINGHLKEGMNALDLLKATFPPGSITGAPKIRAMEIISELEGQVRGPYCGALGYFSFTGDMDSSVIIRTFSVKNNQIYFSAGGAIVLDSDPEEEYSESLAKAKALIEALMP